MGERILNTLLIGMLIGNVESTVEVFSFSEFIDGDKIHKESTHRITEYGVGPSINMIVKYLKEHESIVKGA